MYRYRREGEDDSKFNASGRGLMPMSESYNTSNQWKQVLLYSSQHITSETFVLRGGIIIFVWQDLILKVREHEEEIAQLRKHLADYSVKAGY